MSLISASTPLLADVRQLIDYARQRVASTVNAELTQLYWQIGSRVNAELLKGQRAEYGKQVVVELAQQLTTEFGKGWSERQLRYCLRIAEVFPDAQILHTLCSQLSWSHLRLIIQIDEPLKREFLYVDDMAAASVFVMNLPKPTYDQHTSPMLSHTNVGYGQDVTIAESAQTIASVVGYTGTISFDTTKPDGAPRKWMDSTRINNLGWQAKVSLSQGLALAYQDFIQNVVKGRGLNA